MRILGTTANSRNSTSQGIKKAVRVLRCFSEGTPRPLALAEIATMTGWTKSSLSRLLAALVEGGLVERDDASGRFHPGLELVALASAALDVDPLRASSRSALEMIAAESRETANLSVRSASQLLTIDEVASPEPLKLSGWIGAKHPLHASSSGKVLLAALDHDELEHALAPGLERLTAKTTTAKKKLRLELADIRRVGYAINDEELELGLVSVAAPVRDNLGRVLAAISAAGPSSRLRGEQLERCIAIVQKGALNASRKLGSRLAS